MSPYKFRPKKRDDNEAGIIAALEAAECRVIKLEGGLHSVVLDLLVEYWDPRQRRASMALQVMIPAPALAAIDDVAPPRRMLWMQMEVKNLEARRPGGAIAAADVDPGGQYVDVLKYCTRETALYLKPGQARMLRDHTAPMAVVTTAAEALAAVGIEVES